MKHCIVGLIAVSMLCMTARADWDYRPDDPVQDWKMHWPQLPDLSQNGMDVYSVSPIPGDPIIIPPRPEVVGKLLADDWHCTETGWVKDIHIWGSWLNDEMPDPIQPLAFNLKIYKDVAAGDDPNPDITYSHPGELLWEVYGIEPVARPHYTVPQEQFYDPNLGEIIGEDFTVWQYNFFFDETAAEPPFWQEECNIYWLSVEPLYDPLVFVDPEPGQTGDEYWEVQYRWGWKTADLFQYPDGTPEPEHFMDDAVFWDIVIDEAGGVTVGPYNELRYPEDDLLDPILWGQSLDLAFVITPEPATMGLLGLGLAGLALKRKKK